MGIYSFFKNVNKKRGEQANSEDVSRNTENLYEKACKEYSDAISIDLQNANLYIERSKAYHSLKKYNLAIEDIGTAIQLDPQNHFYFYFFKAFDIPGFRRFREITSGYKASC